MTIVLRAVAAALFAGGSTVGALACASLAREPTVRVAEVALVSVGLAGATARVTLSVVNPNRFALDARALDYRLAYLPDSPGPRGADEVPEEAWHLLASGSTTEAQRLPARDSARVAVDIPFRYEALGRALGELLREGELHSRLSGTFLVGSPVGEFRLPFQRVGLLQP